MYVRTAQAICGFAIFFLALWLWWSLVQVPPNFGTKIELGDRQLCLMIVGPALCMAVGSFLQTVFRWLWPVVLVMLGSAVAACLGGLVWFMFAFIGYRFPEVYVYLGLIPLTALLSLANAIATGIQDFSYTGAEQIVGREPR
jgi:hypothetical protein